MKKILLSSTALLMMSFGAMAADLPTRMAPAAPYAAPLFTWTGFYVGLNAGAAFGNSNNVVDVDGYGALLGVNGLGSKTSFVGGVQAGYNYQISNFVLGLEGDIDYLDQKRSVLALGNVGGDTFVRNRASYLATIRGRLGFAVDRALIYVTGGVAFSDAKSSFVDACNVGACGPALISASARTNTGYAVGGGIEYAITNNWTAKAEYLYTHFDGKTFSGVSAPGGVTFRFRSNDTSLNLVRVGVNYKF